MVELSEKMKRNMQKTMVRKELNKIPVTLVLDDPAPRVHVYYEHAVKRITADERPLVADIPNSFMQEFCRIVEETGMRGKFSIVPMPGGRGDIVNGIAGFPFEEIKEWLNLVKNRLGKYFSFGPEILTHAKAVDLSSGKLLEMNEAEWSRTQTTATLTPYIKKGLFLLKETGIEASGVVSPWDFGIKIEDDYVAAIAEAMYEIYEKRDSWYVLRSLNDKPEADKPWIAYDEDGKRVM